MLTHIQSLLMTAIFVTTAFALLSSANAQELEFL